MKGSYDTQVAGLNTALLAAQQENAQAAQAIAKTTASEQAIRVEAKATVDHLRAQQATAVEALRHVEAEAGKQLEAQQAEHERQQALLRQQLAEASPPGGRQDAASTGH